MEKITFKAPTATYLKRQQEVLDCIPAIKEYIISNQSSLKEALQSVNLHYQKYHLHVPINVALEVRELIPFYKRGRGFSKNTNVTFKDIKEESDRIVKRVKDLQLLPTKTLEIVRKQINNPTVQDSIKDILRALYDREIFEAILRTKMSNLLAMGSINIDEKQRYEKWLYGIALTYYSI